MLITLNVPDNTAKITYATLDDSGIYIGDDRPVTADMPVEVKRDMKAEMTMGNDGFVVEVGQEV